MTSPSRTERDPPLPPVVRVRRSEALEEARRRRRPRDMAERAFPSSARLLPGRACQDLQGQERRPRSEAWILDCVLPRTIRIPVGFGSYWHRAHAELWDHAVQPPGAQSTTGHWHLSTVLSLSFPHHLGSHASTRLGCQQPSAASENQGSGERRRSRKRRRERKRKELEKGEQIEKEKGRVTCLWPTNYTSHVNNANPS